MADLQLIWAGIQNNLLNFNVNQQEEIKNAIYSELGKYNLEEKNDCYELTTYDEDKKGYTMFFVAKKVEGLSKRTLKYYKDVIDYFLTVITKPLSAITSDDVRLYLALSQTQRKVSQITMENERRILHGFFQWLSNEGYIQKNICSSIKKVKAPRTKKKAFSETEIEKIKEACTKLETRSKKQQPIKRKRATALVEFLLSTGCRAGEAAILKREDINLENRTAIVFGKGSKERIVFLTPVCKMRLLEYWEVAGDSEWCFCRINGDNNIPLNVSGIEIAMREIGATAKVKNCHPHRFRRTCATIGFKKGMSVLDVQRMLGHDSADTTKIYLDLDDSDLKYQHEKFFD